jgi:hypothetical protein
MTATVAGDVRRSYGLRGLAGEEKTRPLLADQLEYLGLIDLQDTILGRNARDTGNEPLRVRVVTDLTDYKGWEKSVRGICAELDPYEGSAVACHCASAGRIDKNAR